MDWMVEVSWSCQDAPELKSMEVVKAILDELKCYAPVFTPRGPSRHAVRIYVRAERRSEAEDQTVDLVRLAFTACHLPWPSTRRVDSDIVQPDDRSAQRCSDLIFGRIVLDLRDQGFVFQFPEDV